ncbi:M56 family metallopeptidase [Clostridium sp. MD294]|uniref:M56 family metallopeptidase n=1 Tax=Clostridium sp. MD294 TaxID=97138 RepID=UPI0002CBB024|nr:M56 family metallopeptidase [Clostridium sp. MD294]USF30784.1 hypothetical protein C820_002227 [Clostridium sp. MD294]
MFETMLLHTFQALLKTSIGMIPFLIIIMLLENKFRKRYSTAWKYSLFWIILLRLLLPVYTGNNENLTLNNILPAVEMTETTSKFAKKYDNNKNNLELSKSDIPSEKITPSASEIKTITIPKIPIITIPEIPKIQYTQYSFFTLPYNTSLIIIFAYIWFFVVITKLLYLLLQYLLFYKKVMRWRTTVLQKNTIEIYKKVCNDMKIKKIPSLFVCSVIESPMCFGMFKKGIYITKQEMSQQHMEMILKHELCHYKRKDLYYQLLCVLVSVIHFFNPFVTAFVKIVERDIELSCDDVVMENCSKEQRKQYSIMILLAINESISKNNVLSIDFVKEKEYMKKRFENILDTNAKKSGKLLLLLLGLIFVLSYTIVEFAAKQQLTLLFYLFNLFAFFSICFIVKTKGKEKKTLYAIIVLCLLVNTLLVGCSQGIQNITEKSEQIESAKKQYSDEEIQRFLKWKTDYVGDNSAVGNILTELGAPDGMVSNGFEIQSDAEPYGIKIYYTIEDFLKTQPYNGSGHGFNNSEIEVNDDVEFHFKKSFMVLFSLIKNLKYVEYHISYQNEQKIMFCVERENVIAYDGAPDLLKEGILEGYTDSVASYRYFLEYVDSMKTESHIGYEQWQKEIDTALDEIIYNKKVAHHSDVESYIQNAPNDSYQKIIQKGKQALYYFLERFEEGTAKGLRGQVMMRACQDILGENIGVTNMPAEEWYERYQSEYNGVYPLYSTVVEEEKDSELLLPRHKKQIFMAIEKEYKARNIKVLSSLLLYTSPNGITHEYENALKTNYYAKIKCYNFEILKQNRGNVLCLKNSYILPVKIAFEQTGDTILLKEVKLQSNEALETFCAEDKQMIPILSNENQDTFAFDNTLEQNLRDYVSINQIDVQYYCIDGKTIQTF